MRFTYVYRKHTVHSNPCGNHCISMVLRVWGYLESIQCPVLVVRGGASDIMALDIAESMHDRIPNATMVTVEGAGHLVMGDRPAGFQKAVTGFLSEV